MDNDKPLSDEEKLKAENDFLKMKIMLEHGADFYQPDKQDISLNPEIEHAFLNHIIEFEKQFEMHKTISVFDKIGQPQHFKNVRDIPDADIEDEWNKLLEYMRGHGVDLTACSPKISDRELYRFTTEELFKHELDDMHIPGMMSGFIYDEFYPDYEYDNTRYAVEDCIKPILCKAPLNFTPWFAHENICLNAHIGLTEESLKEVVNQWKEKFEDIILDENKNICCEIQDTICTVTGTHETILDFGDAHATVIGNWRVKFMEDDGFWNIVQVEIENVDL